jgi:hypothetical protein
MFNMDADFSMQILPGTLKQGYLVKSPPLDKGKMKQWKKRFFILYQNGDKTFFQYYESYDAAMTSVPIDVVALRGCLGISSNLIHKAHKHLFSVQLPQRTYYLSASTEEEMNEWVDSFCQALGFSNPQPKKSASLPRPLPPVPASERPLPSLPQNGMTHRSLYMTSSLDRTVPYMSADFVNKDESLYIPVEGELSKTSPPALYSLHTSNSSSFPSRIF